MKNIKLLTKARYFGYILLVSVLFVGCDVLETPIDKFEKLTAPIVLVGKSKDGSVTVCDSKNKYVTIGEEFYLAKTISNTYEKGDTLCFLNGN